MGALKRRDSRWQYLVMARFKQSPYVFVQETANRGLGVFARRPIPENTVIERVPVLIFPTKFLWHPEETSPLANYVFAWDDDHVAIALGFGSLYNHSYAPNASYEDWGTNNKQYVAIRDIGTGEEITINYNGIADDRSPVGFDVR